MARMHHIVGIAALGLAITGCVPQEKYVGLKMERDQLAAQVGKAQAEAEQNKALADAYKRQLDAFASSGNTSTAMLTNLQQQNADLQARLDELNKKYSDAVSMTGRMGGSALPEPLTNELSAFAAQNPDLVDFDRARGIVKFKSDVTFASGDATVTPKAKEVLGKFSSILNSAGASGYELLVAGHTDSTPVVNAETIRRGHLDNWYLSAHRAIAVLKELTGDGVSPRRLGAVGYADQRGIASNSTDSGKAQNRRVEVLILPTSVRSSPGVAAASPTFTPAAAPARHVHHPELNKDTAGGAMEVRGVLNK